MSLGKPMFFALCYFSKMKQNLARKDRTLFNTPKPACEIWSCFGNVQFKPKISNTLFPPYSSLTESLFTKYMLANPVST